MVRSSSHRYLARRDLQCTNVLRVSVLIFFQENACLIGFFALLPSDAASWGTRVPGLPVHFTPTEEPIGTVALGAERRFHCSSREDRCVHIIWYMALQ